MRWEGYKVVQLKRVKLPGDIKSRMKLPHVIELAASIKELGDDPIHAPSIDGHTMKLLAGRDRVAALMLNGAKGAWFHVGGEMTEQDRLDVEDDENIHRRTDDRDALIARKVARKTKQIEARRKAAPPERKPGRPKTAEGEAREAVAREMGTTADAVRMAQARAQEEVENPNKGSETPPPPPVETYGLPLVTDTEAHELRDVQAAIDEADQALRRAQAALRRVEGVPLFRGVSQLLAQVHGVGVEVRRARPTAVCPYCKRLPGMVGLCRGCNGAAFVAADALLGIADELRLGGAQAMVTQHGRLVPYAKAAKDSAAGEPSIAGKGPATAPRTPAAGTSKRIRVEDEMGNVLSPPTVTVPEPEISEEDIPF